MGSIHTPMSGLLKFWILRLKFRVDLRSRSEKRPKKEAGLTFLREGGAFTPAGTEKHKPVIDIMSIRAPES